MTYATLQDLIDRFGEDELIQLTDRAMPPSGAIDAGVVERVLGDADQLIDGFVGSRYAVPLNPPPDLVRRIGCDVARFYLFTDQPTETVKDAYKEAVRLLERIQAGALTLQAAGVVSPAAPAVTPGAAFVPATDTPIFGGRQRRNPWEWRG